MIRKPPTDWRRRSDPVIDLRGVASGGVAVARTAGYLVRGTILWGFALLWGFGALAGGLFGSLPTLIGVGALAAVMAWQSTRMLRLARRTIAATGRS